MSTWFLLVGGVVLGWVIAQGFTYRDGKPALNRNPLSAWVIALAVSLVAIGVLSVAAHDRDTRNSLHDSTIHPADSVVLVPAPWSTNVLDGKGRSAFATDQEGFTP